MRNLDPEYQRTIRLGVSDQHPVKDAAGSDRGYPRYGSGVFVDRLPGKKSRGSPATDYS